MIARLPVGLHFDVPAATYHADCAEQISMSSGIARTLLTKSPRHAFDAHPRLGNTSHKKSTRYMDLGSTVHALLSGNHADELVVEDFATFRSKAAIEWAELVRDAGKIPVLSGDFEEALKIAAAVREKAVRGVPSEINPFQHGKPEATAIWQHNGVTCRARYDYLIKPDNAPWTIWDWKVTGDVSVQEVRRKVRRFRYDIQEAHYLNGLDVLCPAFAGQHQFIFVFIENAAPYSVRRYVMKPDTRGLAQLDLAKVRTSWAECIKKNEWPDASLAETTAIEVPTFADDETEDTDEIQTT